MSSASCPVAGIHNAESIRPADRSSRFRAAASTSSDSVSTVRRQSRASTEPVSGTLSDRGVFFHPNPQPQRRVAVQQGLEH